MVGWMERVGVSVTYVEGKVEMLWCGKTPNGVQSSW